MSAVVVITKKDFDREVKWFLKLWRARDAAWLKVDCGTYHAFEGGQRRRSICGLGGLAVENAAHRPYVRLVCSLCTSSCGMSYLEVRELEIELGLCPASKLPTQLMLSFPSPITEVAS